MVFPNEEKHPNTPNAKEEDTLPVTIKELLEAGVHFGHKRRRWNPKMKPYIFAERQQIHIIDLRKTMEQLKKAYDKMREVARQGGSILFVCTKPQGKDVVREEAERAGVFYMTERWLGGTLTNFETIRSRIDRLRELERMREDGTLDLLPKKEAAKLMKELERLEKVLGGIKDMDDIPNLMFVIDIVNEEIAVKEARKLGVFLIGLVDTNGDPEMVDIPIPGNDDAIRSIKLITRVMADAVIEGREGKEYLIKSKEMEVDENKEAV